jgi:hypothetical protein
VPSPEQPLREAVSAIDAMKIYSLVMIGIVHDERDFRHGLISQTLSRKAVPVVTSCTGLRELGYSLWYIVRDGPPDSKRFSRL